MLLVENIDALMTNRFDNELTCAAVVFVVVAIVVAKIKIKLFQPTDSKRHCSFYYSSLCIFFFVEFQKILDSK